MELFRICKPKWAPTAFDGKGAARYPGRWNVAGVRMVYAANSKPLSMLEQLVHYDKDDQPPLVIIRAELPEEFVQELSDNNLPTDWDAQPTPFSTQLLGKNWIASDASFGLAVPSTTCWPSAEKNILLNPLHPDATQLKIYSPEPFSFDKRLME